METGDHKYGTLALPVLVLGVAAFLRLACLPMVQYREDDDELWNIVSRIAHTGQIPVAGMHSSIGLPNGPFQALLLVPFGWVDASPALMTAGVGMLNLLAVALVYGFVRDFFGRRVALLAMLLVAINPWAVVLSRRLWGDDMVAPFAVLALWALSRWLCRCRSRLLPVAAAALATLAQVYIVGLECLATAGVALLLGGRRLRSRWTLVAILVFAALTGPYVAGAVLPRVQSLAGITGTSGTPAPFDLTAVRYALDLASEEGYQAFAMQGGSHVDATSGLPALVGIVARLLYLLGIAIGLWSVLRGAGPLRAAPRVVHLLLLVWIAVPILALLRHAVPVYPYYLVTTFPAPYVYQALGLQHLWRWAARLGRRYRRSGQAIVLVAGGALVAVPLALAAVFFSVMGQYWPAAIYGMPWGLSDQLARETMQLQQRYHVARVLVPQSNQELNVLYRLLVQRGAPAEEFDDQRMVVLSAEPGLYLAIGDAPAQRYLAATFPQEVVQQERLPGAGVMVRWYMLPANAGGAPLPAETTALNWTVTPDDRKLLQLDSVQIPARLVSGTTVTAALTMTPVGKPGTDIPDFSVYLHLIDQNGRAIAGQDQPMLPSGVWHPGDRIIQWFTLALPASTAPGVLHTALGLYSVGLPDHPVINALTLRDAANHDMGTSGVGPSLVVPPPPPAQPAHPLALRFTGGITLQGDDLRQSGQTLTVTLHWLADVTVTQSYTAFVHVLDPTGKLVAQHDGQPADGRFPTSFWRPGDHIADVHVITLPPGLAPGGYSLEIGLYNSLTLQRLAPTTGEAEQVVMLPLNPPTRSTS